MTTAFMIGCDPELMIVDTKDKLKSCIPLIDGSKHDPQAVTKGAILSDNVNFEFNVEPARNKAEFVDNIKAVLLDSVKIISKKKMKFVVRASADFPAAELKDPRAQEFGCEPDFDAWTVSQNFIEDSAASKSFRSAGGHIHIGSGKGSEFVLEHEGRIRMIRCMDALVGIPSIIMDKDTTSAARRELYGKAGCHRPKEYGVEYRALGNFWVQSPFLTELIYDMTAVAVDFCAKGKDEALIKAIGSDVIVNTINKSNVKMAIEIYNNSLKSIFSDDINNRIQKAVEETSDFYSSWGL